MRSTREHRAGRPQALAQEHAASGALPLDLAPGGVYQAAQVALSAGGLLHHRFTLTPGRVRRRSVFCGTIPRVTPGRRYRPPCPAEPGPSSARQASLTRRGRPSQLVLQPACTARTWHPVNGVTFGPFAPRCRFYPTSDQSAGARPLSRSGRNPFLDTAFRSPAATIHLAVNHHGRVNVPGLHLRNDSEIFLCPFGFELPPPFGFLWPLRGALNA